jgi:hypothetical protein
MRSLRTAVMSLLFCALVVAQGAPATLSGMVSDPNGMPVATAHVRVTNTQTGAIYTATSTGDGTYSITNLRAGTYDLLIPDLGFMFKWFEQKAIAVAATPAARLDVRLEWGGNLGTPGDDLSLLTQRIRRHGRASSAVRACRRKRAAARQAARTKPDVSRSSRFDGGLPLGTLSLAR